jgi:hypothetical protein
VKAAFVHSAFLHSHLHGRRRELAPEPQLPPHECNGLHVPATHVKRQRGRQQDGSPFAELHGHHQLALAREPFTCRERVALPPPASRSQHWRGTTDKLRAAPFASSRSIRASANALASVQPTDAAVATREPICVGHTRQSTTARPAPAHTHRKNARRTAIRSRARPKHSTATSCGFANAFTSGKGGDA